MFPGDGVPASGLAIEWESPRYERGAKEINTMNILIAIIAIVAVILLFTGGFVQSLNFLLWVGIVLLVLAVIVWLVRYLGGRTRV